MPLVRNAGVGPSGCSRILKVLPVLFFVAILAIYLTAPGKGLHRMVLDMSNPSTAENLGHFIFSAPTGYFLPARDSTNPSTFDPTTSNFGLISQAYDSDGTAAGRNQDSNTLTDWQRFHEHLYLLNSQAPQDTSYHVLFLARHGQGYHNLAESYYGTDSWDCYWSELDGDPDSDVKWLDAHLSRLGKKQARAQSAFWTTQLDDQKMPAPTRWFVSPMDRACNTLQLTFEPLAAGGKVHDWQPVVKELLRETNGIHTCDQRSPRSVISARYPQYLIEEGFTEQDELWDPVYRETQQAHTDRASRLLDDVLNHKTSHDSAHYTSITAHGGMINAILRAVGHREFQVQVGSAIAVIVKADRVNGERKRQDFGNGPTKPKCLTDPLKAGLPGYTGFKDYVEKVEASVPHVE